MEDRTVELRKVGVRGTLPLCLKWSEYLAMIYTFLDEQPEALTSGLKAFYCPLCEYAFLNGYLLGELSKRTQKELPDDFKLASLLLKRTVDWGRLTFCKEEPKHKEEPLNGKRIKEFCKRLQDWLADDNVIIRVIEKPNVCKHSEAVKCDLESYD